ncbi:putative Phospholipid-translocating ATPase [Rhodotorula taiwanensis]|uniref:Putative Phospholipid-translocating ATPase n=1 Tax=Rhodotorula taiwanensis TaxID=741276 RepID=A0A2S5B8E3_9BASI|nr:putative Phospholipid-translocating ATPase [Rhodotorula taiwanensis]
MRNGGGGGKSGYGYAGSEAGTAQSVTDGGGDAHSEADSLLGGIEPDPNSRGTRRSGRTARGRRGEAAIPVGLGGRGESDGDFDAGWTNGLEAEEEEIGLLASGRLDRDRPPTTGGPSPPGKPTRTPSSFKRFFALSAPPSSQPRTIVLNEPPSKRKKAPHPPNIVKNQKYNLATFLPLVLYEQFKFFYNLYFLLVALSQFVPALRIGFLATYIVPLAFVLAVTIGKEAYDDYVRYLRDRSANSAKYSVLTSAAAPSPHSHHASSSNSSPAPLRPTPSADLRVGDLVHLDKNDRVPADVLLLRTSDPSGTCFVRTDQLDGETDWKLRVAVEKTQALATDADLLQVGGEAYADPPTKDIHTFVGNITLRSWPTPAASGDDAASQSQDGPIAASNGDVVEPLTAENMLWANTVLAAGSAVGVVVYTGRETRAVMNTSQPGTKVGLLDHEINRLAKILCAVTFVLSVVLVALNGFRGHWWVYVFRFLILFSSIIPIS